MSEKPQTGDPAAAARRRLRHKNLAVLAVLVGLVALFYFITLARMGGTS